MKLSLTGIQSAGWEEKGYLLPRFDIAAMREATRKAPVWLHFGAGNLMRAFPAVLQQELLEKGLADKGIIIAEAFDEEIIDKAYAPFDHLGIVVTLGSDGSMKKRVVASIAEAVKASRGYGRLREIMTDPGLQMATLCITEKGYQVKDASGGWLPWVKEDIERFAAPKGLMGLLTKLCHERYQAGSLPLALVSLDNCSRNGDVLKNAVFSIAEAWRQAGRVDEAFLGYLGDSEKISFTWSMIDKITPRPDEAVAKLLAADGVESAGAVQTAKNSYVGCYVNTETAQYLAIEEHFPNGRPPLDKAGVLFCGRETVDRIEQMKVRTALNPLHTVLAVYGCLLGYSFIYEEMKDENLTAFITKLGYDELMPKVVHPGIIDPMSFIGEVIGERFPNPFIPDTPQRIATDTSLKIPVRFGETIAAYGGEAKGLTYIPLFIAGWLRYLGGTDDTGAPMQPSPDPRLAGLQASLQKGDGGLREILSDKSIFIADLYQAGLADKIIAIYRELCAGNGAVRRVLRRYC
jgi:fructuronate reductase